MKEIVPKTIHGDWVYVKHRCNQQRFFRKGVAAKAHEGSAARASDLRAIPSGWLGKRTGNPARAPVPLRVWSAEGSPFRHGGEVMSLSWSVLVLTLIGAEDQPVGPPSPPSSPS